MGAPITFQRFYELSIDIGHRRRSDVGLRRQAVQTYSYFIVESQTTELCELFVIFHIE